MSSLFAHAGDKEKTFTRCDTVRGSLSPERSCYDVKYYDLSVTVDTLKQSISGVSKIQFLVTESFDVMQIDLFSNMIIDQIEFNGTTMKYRRDCDAVFVYFRGELAQRKGNIVTLNVYYHGYPIVAKRAPWDGGFIWKTDNTGKPWICTAVQGIGASVWWPTKEYLGDECDSMRMRITVPQSLQAICNGKLEKDEPQDNGVHTQTWFISYPINNYNVTLNIGNYAHFGEIYTYRDGEKLNLDYYVMPYNLEKAKAQFKQVKPMMECYDKFLGKYPFMRDGYKLVETPYLGMEHQSAIAYGNNYKTGYLGSDYSKIGLTFDYIVIHESGHEWWGNSVSSKDVADMWIHESLCTYTESMYVECTSGPKVSLQYINAKKPGIGNDKPMQGPYGVSQEGDGDMYNKGALVFNTFRYVVNNDALWWSTIKGLCDTAFKYKTVDAKEFMDYINKKTGKNLNTLFSQYYQHAAIPQFTYSLKETGKKKYTLTYRWDTDVANFDMPVSLDLGSGTFERINCTNTTQTRELKINRAEKFRIEEDLAYFKVVKL